MIHLECDNSIQFILVGDEYIGKTKLFLSFQDKPFEDFSNASEKALKPLKKIFEFISNIFDKLKKVFVKISPIFVEVAATIREVFSNILNSIRKESKNFGLNTILKGGLIAALIAFINGSLRFIFSNAIHSL